MPFTPPRDSIVRTTETCKCGGTMVWAVQRIKYGLFLRKRLERWQLVCPCGRCGPWRWEPDTKRIPFGPGSVQPTASAPKTPPPPKK